jgi:hypothetical protein
MPEDASLEGAFPGGLSPGILVQLWGHLLLESKVLYRPVRTPMLFSRIQ